MHPRLAKRHQRSNDLLDSRLANVNEFIFAKVYFPTRSNTLKDLGSLLGVRWSSQDASGLQSLVWRHRWEVAHDPKYRELLVAYNREDCQALQVLTDELRQLGKTAEARSDVDFADNPKQSSTRAGEDIHRAFKGIIRSAHADYSRKHIRIKQGRTTHIDEKDKPSRPPRRKRRRTAPGTIGRVIEVPRRRKCPHHTGEALNPSRSRAERVITDLDFTRAGCRKTVVKYTGMRARCPRCEQYYDPPAFTRLPGRFLGYRLLAWMCYLRMSLRLPQRAIVRLGEDLFGERVSPGWVNAVVEHFADLYSPAERRLLDCIRSSAFVHVDETGVNIKGVDHYAWVFTNGKHVIFRITHTRESGIVKDLLSDYSGILISDFYPGYDSLECRQQKCLVHLIRDLNDDLWSNPYNTEFEGFVAVVKDLLVPIFSDVEKYGLKARHLRKFRRPVDRFYDRHISARKYGCEVTEKYRKRFDRYRESLFRFFEEDGIPWHNNTAERALRHLAVQRKISGSFGDRRMKEYLRLLGISQSCSFQGKSFLKFLLSGDKYVDDFKQGKRLRKARPVCP